MKDLQAETPLEIAAEEAAKGLLADFAVVASRTLGRETADKLVDDFVDQHGVSVLRDRILHLHYSYPGYESADREGVFATRGIVSGWGSSGAEDYPLEVRVLLTCDDAVGTVLVESGREVILALPPWSGDEHRLQAYDSAFEHRHRAAE